MHSFLAPNFQDLAAVARQNKQQYGGAVPFPHIYFENFFDPAFLQQVRDEFPDLATRSALHYNNPNEKKFASKGEADFGPKTKELIWFLQSAPFLEFLQEITSIKETLLGDPYLIGGGLHEIKRGGLLKVHADFNKHSLTGLDRRLNILIYLNNNWKEEYGGHFELWDKDMKEAKQRILPAFNTLAMFSTTDTSYHGHPDALTCPEGESRKSIALYYYSNGRPASEIDLALADHSTLFKARAGYEKEVVAPSVRWQDKVKQFIPPVLLSWVKK